MKYIISFLVLFPSLLFAGTVDTISTVSSVGVVTEEYTLLTLNGSIDGLPQCAAAQPTLVSFKHTTEQGKAFLAVALSALHTNKTLKVVVRDDVCGAFETRALLARLYLYVD